MRFVSKSTNLNVILRPSIPGNPMTGTPAQPGLSARFMDGIIDVKDQDMIDLMLRHPAFNSDFIAVDEGERDPYAYNRSDSEPDHIITEMRYGMPERRIEADTRKKLSPEMMKLVQEYAKEMVKEILQQNETQSVGSVGTAEPVAPQIVAEETEDKIEVTLVENDLIETVVQVPKKTSKPAGKEA